MAGFAQELGEHGAVYGPYDWSAELDLVQSVITDDLKSQSGDRISSSGQEWTVTQSHQIQNYQVDQHCGVSQRRKRIHYTQAQLNMLERFFQYNKYPAFHHREQLAKRLCICESRVQVWFQNRRSKAKRLNETSKRNHPP